LAVADAAAEELRPPGNDRKRVGALGQKSPELRVMPAERVRARVPVCTDAGAQPLHLREQLFAGHRLEVLVHGSALDRAAPVIASLRSPECRPTVSPRGPSVQWPAPLPPVPVEATPARSFRTTAPPFITKKSFSITAMSRDGSPGTATRSA